MKTPQEQINEFIEISDSLIYEIQQSNILARNKMIPTDLKIKMIREMTSNLSELNQILDKTIINLEYLQIDERENEDM